MRDEEKIKRLKEINSALLELNKYPEINSEEPQHPEVDSEIEAAYSTLLWKVQEALRMEDKKE